VNGQRKASRKQTERAERLAAALRENLKRRKAQARGRVSKAEAGAAAAKKPNPDSDMSGA